MTRDEQEMALWAAEYAASKSTFAADRAAAADLAAAFFAHRYPPDPSATPATAPPAVWYDEPPFEKDGTTRPCWIAGKPFPCAVYWSGHEWTVYVAGDFYPQQLAGRRVYPITKPQEPTQ